MPESPVENNYAFEYRFQGQDQLFFIRADSKEAALERFEQLRQAVCLGKVCQVEPAPAETSETDAAFRELVKSQVASCFEIVNQLRESLTKTPELEKVN